MHKQEEHKASESLDRFHMREPIKVIQVNITHAANLICGLGVSLNTSLMPINLLHIPTSVCGVCKPQDFSSACSCKVEQQRSQSVAGVQKVDYLYFTYITSGKPAISYLKHVQYFQHRRGPEFGLGASLFTSS